MKTISLNITIVECKYETVRGRFKRKESLNITIVECKYTNYTVPFYYKVRLNITIVECKYINANRHSKKCFVLI